MRTLLRPCITSFDPAAESLHTYVFLIEYRVLTYWHTHLTPSVQSITPTHPAHTQIQVTLTHWPKGTFTSSPLSGVNAAFSHMSYVLVKTSMVAMKESSCLVLQSYTPEAASDGPASEQHQSSNGVVVFSLLLSACFLQTVMEPVSDILLFLFFFPLHRY